MAGMLNPDRPDPADVTDVKTVVAEVPVDDVTDVSREAEDPNAYDDDDEEPNVTDEEQAAYQAFIEASFELIYADGKVNPGIIAMLDDDPSDLIAVLGEIPEIEERFSPIVALAAASVMVTMEVIRRSPERPDDSIIMHGGRAILEDLAQLATTDFEQDELNQALMHAVDIYRSAAAQEGMIDEQQAQDAFAELLNAQEEGREDEVVPGISRFANGDR